MVKHLFAEETVPVPPDLPAFAIVLSITSRGYRFGGTTAAGVGGKLYAVAPQSVKKNILRVSHEN
jgi:hypothetical protein